MTITQESTGNLTAMIKIELVPDDYAVQVNNSLKEIQKKSALKGFRPGKVPIGLIKKLYEKGAIAEEVNKLLSESLNKYIIDNKLELLGYPLANLEKTNSPDFDDDQPLDFYFDIGLAPSFMLDITQQSNMEYYDIQVEDKTIDNYVNDIRQRLGKFTEAELVEADDMIEGEIKQLDASGSIAENGIVKKATLILKKYTEEARNGFLGKKKDDKIMFNPLKASGNEVDTASMLGIKKDDTAVVGSDFEFTIQSIHRIEPAELNEELYARMYPKDNIKDPEQFRTRIAEEIRSVYVPESDSYFVHMAMEKMVSETVIDLPSEFIKRWLVDSDKDLTLDLVEKNLNDYLSSLKHQLILNKISSAFGIRVDKKEVSEYFWNYLTRQYAFGEESDEKTRYLESLLETLMRNKEEVNKVTKHLFDEKLKALFKEKIPSEKKEVTYKAFLKIVSEHHKIHNHEHK